MGVLDQIMQMKNQGIQENQIVSNLQQQGISPRQITDALAQSQIKSAISGEEMGAEMQPSIMQEGIPGEETAPQMMSQQYSPQTQEMNPQAYAPQGGEYYEEYAPGASSTGTDTIIEIANQVFSEKIQKLQKKINEVNDFKNLAEVKLEGIENRLKRIENTIDKLQIEILGKVGSYGETLGSIKKEMSMMQDSFGKVMKKESTSEEKSSKKK